MTARCERIASHPGPTVRYEPGMRITPQLLRKLVWPVTFPGVELEGEQKSPANLDENAAEGDPPERALSESRRTGVERPGSDAVRAAFVTFLSCNRWQVGLVYDGCFEKQSSPGWTRTNNPSVNSRMLCQLSYRGSRGGIVTVARQRAEIRARR